MNPYFLESAQRQKPFDQVSVGLTTWQSAPQLDLLLYLPLLSNIDCFIQFDKKEQF